MGRIDSLAMQDFEPRVSDAFARRPAPIACTNSKAIRPIRKIRVPGSTGFFERVESVDALRSSRAHAALASPRLGEERSQLRRREGDATTAVWRRAWTTIGPAVP